ncbi:MAG: ABC transporter ATP-binding protein [Candidatus Korobacteraceae bacterium]
MSDGPVFEVNGVHFEYEQIPALRGLSLTITRGQSVALVGANGSGKSTLLRLLDALCFPSSGSITFCGEPLTPERLRNNGFALSFRRRVALVFQNPDVQLFNPTVFDEIAFGPLQMGWSSAEVIGRVDQTLDTMGIAHLRDRAPYRLSGGEKKRVALASVIVLDPEVLLLDEPTAMLDPRSQSQLIDLIQNWRGTSKTVITATHQLEIIEDIADRIFVLEQGSVTAAGTPHEILSNGELLLHANLVHAHRHKHGEITHSHPHVHSHGEHKH